MVNTRKTGSIDAPPITVAQRSRIRFTRSAQGFSRLYLISTVKIPARSPATTAEFVMPLKLGVIITCRKLTLARPITSANCSRRVSMGHGQDGGVHAPLPGQIRKFGQSLFEGRSLE